MSKEGALDSVFLEGPVNFVESRLREYLLHVNPELKAQLEKAALEDPVPENPMIEEESEPAVSAEDSDSLDEESEAEDPDFQGADAWKKNAVEYCRELRWGSVDDFEAVWGTPPSAELVAFEKAVEGINPWSSFNELRLSEGTIINPSEDKNLFEMMVLLDQLAYLGTSLAEAFSGVVCLGSLGDGDTYHYDVSETPGNDGTTLPRYVHDWTHDEHQFYDGPYADSISSLTYLCAITNAIDKELVSEEVAEKAFQMLHERVSPSWHFSMEDYDEDFEELESEFALPGYYFWRSAWIQYFLRNNGLVNVEDLEDMFVENLNQPLDEETFKLRFEGIKSFAHTAIYSMWKAFLFDEPELEQVLVVCLDHKSRIARDCAKLIREFQNGRKELGRISDIHDHISRFRALDLDPRRSGARAKEEAEAQSKAVLEMETRLLFLDALPSEKLEAFAWDNISENESVPFQSEWSTKFTNFSWQEGTEKVALREAILLRLKSELEAPGKEGIQYLMDSGFSRRNSMFSSEREQATRWVATHLSPVLQAIVVGDFVYPHDGSSLSHHDSFSILETFCTEKDLDPRTLPHLRSGVKLGLDGRPEWGASRFVKLLGSAKDEGALEVFEKLLKDLPEEGGFETGLHFDDFISDIAIAIQHIGKPKGAEMLVRFAGSESLRNTRTASAFTIAKIAPELGDRDLCAKVLLTITKVNDGRENGRNALAFGLLGSALNENDKGLLLEILAMTEPMANSYVEAKVAMAAANLLLGEKGEYEGESFEHWLGKCFSEKGWEEEYTLKRRRWALEVYEVLPKISLEEYVDELQSWHDPKINAALRNHNLISTLPQELTWFEAKKMDASELIKVLGDPSIAYRWHAVRVLGSHSPEIARDILERIVLEVAAQSPQKAEKKLPRQQKMLLEEAVIALVSFPNSASTTAVFDTLLRHPNRSVKDQVLRNPPADPALAQAMQIVLTEGYGWQGSTAEEWLEEHAGDLKLSPPEGVNPDAWWDADDNEWVFGAKDDEDEFQGLVKYWRPDGTLCCQTDYEGGKPGKFTRFHENGDVSRDGWLENRKLVGKDTAFRCYVRTTERAFPSTADERIHSIETYWQDGNYTHQIMRDKEGNPLTRSGDPVPQRPSNVPEEAVFESGNDIWAFGVYTKDSQKVGKWVYYDSDGEIDREEEYNKKGKLIS